MELLKTCRSYLAIYLYECSCFNVLDLSSQDNASLKVSKLPIRNPEVMKERLHYKHQLYLVNSKKEITKHEILLAGDLLVLLRRLQPKAFISLGINESKGTA